MQSKSSYTDGGPDMSLAPYETRDMDGNRVNELALEILRQFDGMGVNVARRILRRAEFWLDATSTVDCSTSSEFQRAVEGSATAPVKSD